MTLSGDQAFCASGCLSGLLCASFYLPCASFLLVWVKNLSLWVNCLHLRSGFPLLQHPRTQPHSRVPWSGGRLWACSKSKTYFNCFFSPFCFLRISLQRMALAKWLSNKTKWCKPPSVPPPSWKALVLSKPGAAPLLAATVRCMQKRFPVL